jgi:signal transduction histidine kinase
MSGIVTSGPSAASREPRLRSLASATATALGSEERERECVRQARSSRRDWIVDTICFLLAVAVGVLVAGSPYTYNSGGPSSSAMVLIVAAGVLSCLAIWWRRRWPAAVAIVAVVLNAVSPAASGATLVALFSVAIHRRPMVAIAIAALATATLPLYFSIYPNDWVDIALAAGIQLAIVGWGMFIRSRLELMLSLRQRARQAEAERDLRVRQAREHERTRIAREMHDVVAHRLSLLSVHAGALEIHPDAPPEQIARAASIVRASAHQALEDLRQVIDVLRADPAGSEERRPQPTLGNVADLVEESREAGTAVELEQRVDVDSLPATTGRTVYRIVQEGLTNARKHAAGGAVEATIDGAPGRGLTVEIVSRRPLAQLGQADIPGAGAGLVGLAERVSLAGGRLEHGRTASGDYRLWAWLPWPA